MEPRLWSVYYILCQYEPNSTWPLLFGSLSSIGAGMRDHGTWKKKKTGESEAFLLAHSIINMVIKWWRLHWQRMHFQLFESHMSLKACESGILFPKTLKVVQAQWFGSYDPFISAYYWLFWNISTSSTHLILLFHGSLHKASKIQS